MSSRDDAWESISKSQRIVVKIGTRSLLLEDGSFDFKTIATLVQNIKALMRDDGKEVILVTSGAVSAGMKKLGMEERPRDLVLQQVTAAVGNPLLLNEYIRMFGEVPVAQILLTQQDLSNRKSFLHFLNTMERLLEKGIVPIVNENDVVSIDELVDTRMGESGKDYNFSDNDVLSALVAASTGAGTLVILSDVDGLYSTHPDHDDARFIPHVDTIDEEIKKAGKDSGQGGRGGMVTKLRAAEICMQAGAWMVIGNAKRVELPSLLAGSCKCTVFKPVAKRPNKHLWMIFATNTSGSIKLDEGAVRAIRDGASILLPGIIACRGKFNRGDVIEFLDARDDSCLGKGITNFSSQEIHRFMAIYAKDPASFRSLSLGEVIHRDKMSFISMPPIPQE